MAKFIIVPANTKKGFGKFFVDIEETKGSGVPLNIDAPNIWDIKYVLPNAEQIKQGLPHYYKYYKENCQVIFWVQKIPGNLAALQRLPVRVDIINKKGVTIQQLYCYLKNDD